MRDMISDVMPKPLIESSLSNKYVLVSRQDKTVSVDGLRCILYARIYIPYMRTILYCCIQTGFTDSVILDIKWGF